jgi:MoCo/4Fe-4S cofactor protein with predicted Tat translocation signal
MREIDLAAIRARLASANGKTWWRGLDELADTPEFREMLHREFPAAASELDDPRGRRDFLKLMGASLALAGASACTRIPQEQILPYVRQPEEIVPGRPLYYATAMPFAGAATPVLVESHMGRPTKIEPNPEHPATRGGTDVFAQAATLTLYDPDRSQAIRYLNEIRPWGAFLTAIQGAVNAQRALGGEGLRILTETVVSPTLAAQLDTLVADLPGARWIQWDAVSRDNARAGARMAFGDYVEPQYRFDRADVVLSLDADFLTRGPGRLRYAREFFEARRLAGGRTEMNRLYVVESTPSGTGVKADHRLPLKAADIEVFARAVAARIGAPGGAEGEVPGVPPGLLEALVSDLQAHRGSSLVIVGDEQPAAVHALAHAMNQALGNAGQTVVYTPTPEPRPSEQYAAMRELAADMDAGRVDLLVILSANPVYTAPPDLDFARRMGRVPLRVHLGLYQDETAELCHWHLPETHFLETWSDARAFDGTVTICQPLIEPLYDGISPHQVLAAMTGQADQRPYDLVRGHWERQLQGDGALRAAAAQAGAAAAQARAAQAGTEQRGTQPAGAAGAGSPFEQFWRRAIHDGFVAGTAFEPAGVTAGGEVPPPSPRPESGALEITFRPDSNLHDGRFANNGWLQELPRPITKIVWDNVALVSFNTAQRLGLLSEDLVTLRLGDRAVKAPVWILTGQPDDSIMITIGHGRRRAGRVGNLVGVDVNALRTSEQPWMASGLEIEKNGERYPLACTQGHFSLEGRNHVRVATLGHYQGDPKFAEHMAHDPAYETTLHGNQWTYDSYAWGMSIDLNACFGCNACVVACQAENNIPIVGKDQVIRQREMHWIRIDRYFLGHGADNPETFFQPMLCQQCETAPCEVVCPVAATVHSSEGLNDMVYNRCVGTRYCSHNCPYKVRRFNFYLYADWDTPSLKMARNPDVTVRSRGVMEKCTFCVQRINHARILAKREDRTIRDGEIATACEAACPSQAIVFGDINDPASRVTALKKEPRTYGVLAELNTRPRTTYLAAVRNPHPELLPGETHGGADGAGKH